MIFTHKLFDAIVDGRKTVTRRPMRSKSGRRFNPPVVGDVLPLQRGYAQPSAWARVISVTPEHGFTGNVGQHAEGVREGFADAWEFRDAWRGIYGADPVDVYRIELEVVQRTS